MQSLQLVNEESGRRHRSAAVDCSRTAEVDRGRQALVIVLDLGRVWCGIERWGEEEGGFFCSAAAGLTEPRLNYLRNLYFCCLQDHLLCVCCFVEVFAHIWVCLFTSVYTFGYDPFVHKRIDFNILNCVNVLLLPHVNLVPAGGGRRGTRQK